MYEGSGNTDWSMLMLEVLLKMGRVTSPIVSTKALVTHFLLSTCGEESPRGMSQENYKSLMCCHEATTLHGCSRSTEEVKKRVADRTA